MSFKQDETNIPYLGKDNNLYFNFSLLVLPDYKLKVELHAQDFFISIQDDYEIDYDGPIPVADCGNTDGGIVVPPIDVSLLEEAHAVLSTVNVLRDSNNLGVDIYEEVVQILMTMHDD